MKGITPDVCCKLGGLIGTSSTSQGVLVMGRLATALISPYLCPPQASAGPVCKHTGLQHCLQPWIDIASPVVSGLQAEACPMGQKRSGGEEGVNSYPFTLLHRGGGTLLVTLF